LSGRGDLTNAGKMREKVCHLGFSHLTRMPLAMIQNKTRIQSV
jgi:hypothetical protein